MHLLLPRCIECTYLLQIPVFAGAEWAGWSFPGRPSWLHGCTPNLQLTAPTQKGPELKAVSGPHLPLAAPTQPHQHWLSALELPPEDLPHLLPHSSHSPAPKENTSNEGSHTEGTRRESCRWPSPSLVSWFDPSQQLSTMQLLPHCPPGPSGMGRRIEKK